MSLRQIDFKHLNCDKKEDLYKEIKDHLKMKKGWKIVGEVMLEEDNTFSQLLVQEETISLKPIVGKITTLESEKCVDYFVYFAKELSILISTVRELIKRDEGWEPCGNMIRENNGFLQPVKQMMTNSEYKRHLKRKEIEKRKK